jgi:GT2 family glycosyltransferase
MKQPINFFNTIHIKKYKDISKRIEQAFSSEISNNFTKFDAIVPVYNRPDLLESCIRPLIQCEIIDKIYLIDDFSEDSKFIEIKKLADIFSRDSNGNVLLVRNEKNYGYTNSLNNFIINNKHLSKHVLMVNQDTKPNNISIYSLLQAIQCIPRLAMCGCLSNEAGPQSIFYPKSSKRTEENNILLLDEPENIVNEIKKQLPDIEFIFSIFIHGFFYCLNTKAFQEVGGFDVKNFDIYGEENDLALRLHKDNWITCIAAHSFIPHLKGASYETIEYDEMFYRKKSQRNLKKKHGDLVTLGNDLIADSTQLSLIREALLMHYAFNEGVNLKIL